MNQSEPLRVLAEGKFTRLVATGHWEWVERVNVSGGVVILPITEDRQLVLVQQYRIPVHAPVLELPAGLAGDIPGRGGRGPDRGRPPRVARRDRLRGRHGGDGSWRARVRRA